MADKIAGLPGQGNSAFWLSVDQYASHLLNPNVAVFSPEMSNEHLVQRLIAKATAIDARRLRLGESDDEE